MPQSYPAVPPYPALARRARRTLIVVGAALCLGAADASAQTESGAPARGGAEAGDPAAAPPSATPAPRASTAKPGRSTVRSVQRKLRLRADGVYGARTRAAVRRFQRRKGLKVDGRLGAKTLRALGLGGRAARAPAAATPSPAAPPDGAALLAAIAECESGGDPTAVSADGQYRGKYQFLTATWEAIGGAGDPAAAPEPEQDQRAAALLAAEGTKPWPVCGRRAQAAR